MTERRKPSGGPPWEEWIRAAEDPARVADKPEALDDLLVLDLSHGHYGALLAATYLAELGAEVIKVEPPGGDPARRWGPADAAINGEGLAFLAEARNRYHLTLDLRKTAGRRLLRGLAARADVLVEGFAPGYLDGLGLGYRQLSKLNSRLVYVACSARGQWGPEAQGQAAEYDLTAQALSGFVHVTGDPDGAPMKVGSWISAYAQAVWGTVGALAALHWRQRSGEGQMVDVTGAEALMRHAAAAQVALPPCGLPHGARAPAVLRRWARPGGGAAPTGSGVRRSAGAAWAPGPPGASRGLGIA